MRLPLLLDPRRSFAAKLVAALLTTVGLMLAAMLLVVRSETEGQIALVTARAVERAHEGFEASEARRLEQLAVRIRSFTGGPRGFALVEEAILTRDTAWLALEVGYRLEQIEFEQNSLTVLVDAAGDPVVTWLAGVQLRGDDPAGVRPLAAELLDTYARQLTGYRSVEGELYTVLAEPLDLFGPLVGFVVFGLPITDADAETLGRIAGGEVCLVAGELCAAGTAGARDRLQPLLPELEGNGVRTVRAAGERWAIVAEPLMAERPQDGRMVMAVPLNEVLAPFHRIRGALALASVGALLLAAIISVFLARGLTRPVRELVGATKRVARGDYDAHVSDASRDELGQLARSFNAMTDGLKLKEQYRGVLDKVVSKDVAEELLRGEIRLGGENREVTVMFADVRGFTSLTEGMEPQEVIALLNETMERLGDAVEAAGGVVDKYVGDEIMAVFGAPLAQRDHATRALSAARAMRAAMAEINESRAARGVAPIRIGAGIHTGVAVAGNMGSPSRLNYTVLGETVNLAARLCSAAAPEEILVTEATLAAAGEDAESMEVRSLELKGFSRPVPVHVLTESVARVGRTSARAASRALAALLALVAAGVAAPSSAQSLPTLSDLGLGYISPEGMVQLGFSGRLDVEGYLPSEEPTWIIPSTDPFVAGRARLFGDLFVGSRVFASAELRVDRGEEPAAGDWEARLDQAFARVGPFGPVSIQAGKFVSPFGGWPQRHHTQADPFIRPPLSYDYRTMICPSFAPRGTAGFLAWKDDVPFDFRPTGAPPVWGAPYQWGGMLLGGVGATTFRVAVMNSAPSSEPWAWEWDADRFRHPSFVANAGWQASPALRLEASYNRGPYLEPPVANGLDEGWEWHDYVQEIFGIEAVWAAGPVVLRGEAFGDRWEVPNVPEDAWDWSYYLEGHVDVLAGGYVAARFGQILFNELGGGTGGGYTTGGSDYQWDYDVARLQLAAGYRAFRNAGIRAEVLLNRTGDPAGDPRDDLLSLQLWWEY